MKRFKFYKAMNRRTSCPPAELKKANKIPHLVVASMMRSGTHLAIDLILNNFREYKKCPLYVNLDIFMDFGGNLGTLSCAGGSVIKTHFPNAIECRGHEAEISHFLEQQKVILVTRDFQQIKTSLQNFGQWGADESLRFDDIKNEFVDYWMKKHKGEVLRLDYSDLIQEKNLTETLYKIEQFCGLQRNQKTIRIINKNARIRIFLSKAMTRIIGRFSPRINTGIKLGR